MSKYIIKNCPAYSKDALDFCFAKNATQAICYNCTDCLLKQIVEKCRDAQGECSCKNPNKDVDCFECTSGGRAELGTEILKLLDIQEVE